MNNDVNISMLVVSSVVLIIIVLYLDKVSDPEIVKMIFQTAFDPLTTKLLYARNKAASCL